MGNFINIKKDDASILEDIMKWNKEGERIRLEKQKSNDFCLKFDRILDGENQIYIGVGRTGINETSQVIRIGDMYNKYYKLINFSEKEKQLQYEFEDNVKMTLENNDKDFLIEIDNLPGKKSISKNIDPIIVQNFKPIKLSNVTDDFDKIYNLFNS